MDNTDTHIREKHTPTIEETAKHFHIESGYMQQEHTKHDGQYFVMGNNKIIINEHFGNDGKPLVSILEKVILNAGNGQKTA